MLGNLVILAFIHMLHVERRISNHFHKTAGSAEIYLARRQYQNTTMVSTVFGSDT